MTQVKKAMPKPLESYQNYGKICNFINNQTQSTSNTETLSVTSPYNGKEIAQVALSTTSDVDQAVQAAKKAFATWGKTTYKQRAQYLFRLRSLLERDLDELAQLVALENGKTLGEAAAGVKKGIEVLEYAIALQNHATGSSMEVSTGVRCQSSRVPLGVVASITPFNFPMMVPMWTIPIVLATGNTMIVKPSEQVPVSVSRFAHLVAEAGFPEGVFNVVHGDKSTVEALCDHPDIQAISFVGSSVVAKAVYARAAQSGKRALALGGAKNHLILLPDADLASSPKSILDSAIGCGGQRCMAASVLLAVGEGVQPYIDALAEEAKNVNLGHDMGAIINAKSRDRIVSFIDQAEKDGCKILVDGRNQQVDDCEGGYWVGPTIIDNVKPGSPYATEEIFGPVLSIVRVDSLEDAIAIENQSSYGNAASIFTTNGEAADYLAKYTSSGMVGVNIGVPVPREPFSFGGWNDSRYGAGDITGDDGLAFWTQQKKVTTRWEGTLKGFLEN